jgi:hypothetical protein
MSNKSYDPYGGHNSDILQDIKTTVGDTSRRVQEIERQLAGMIVQMDNYKVTHEQCKAETGRQLYNLRETVYGNGKPGLTTKIDRLEISEGKRTWAIGAVSAATIGLLVSRVWEHLSGGH